MSRALAQACCPGCGAVVQRPPECLVCGRDLRLGEVVGDRYRLDERVGEGGNGEVYRGFDLATRTAVAVKFMLARWVDDPVQRERFHREAVALERLRHPCFVELRAVGNFGDVPFLVMELVEGRNLLDEIDDHVHGLPEARVRRLFMQIADGLAAAHATGIVHRDMKPDNVVVQPGDQVKVLDLGIALLGGAKRLTVDGKARGTALYMAPEQWTCGNIGPATDLYAVGVMMYEALAGEPPFLGLSRPALRQAHLGAEPPPLARTVSREMAFLTYAALAKAPADRPTAADLRDALAALAPPADAGAHGW